MSSDAARPDPETEAIFPSRKTLGKKRRSAKRSWKSSETMLLSRLWLNPEVLRVVQNSELGKTLGRERMFFNLERAVEAFQGRSGSARQGEEGAKGEG
jgi:hypothetical protein